MLPSNLTVRAPDLRPVGKVGLRSLAKRLGDKRKVHGRHGLGRFQEQALFCARSQDQTLVGVPNAVRNLDWPRAHGGHQKLKLWPRLHEVPLSPPGLSLGRVNAIFAGRKANRICKYGGPTYPPLPAPVSGTVIIAGSDLGDRRNLHTLQRMPRKGHAVLDVDPACRCSGAHLHEPRSSKLRISQQLCHAQELRPQPILLVG
mmetsp:Transcript_19662/g.41477  ORF Transcript_19662/g.41477 Transcript_19662/m.41477 type:complete len:202 (-) Transcript_19662:938-1543(-)